MNQQKVDQLAERIVNETNSAVSCLTLYLGHNLDLFNSLKKVGPITSEELSAKTKYSERYMREWLECMTVNGYIDYDPSTNKFSISEEHARVLCDRDNIAYTIPFVYWVPTLSLVMDKLLEAFRTGEGIPYSTYGKMCCLLKVKEIDQCLSTILQDGFLRCLILNELRSQGGHVLEVGCGDGWASISLAKSFPLIKIDAIDIDLSSINNASNKYKEPGLSERISAIPSPIEKCIS